MSKNKLPDGYTLDILKNNYDTAYREHQRAFRRMRLLDAADRAKLWETIKKGYPDYQLLPDSNHVSYVKNNIAASVYTVGKSANIIPTSSDDKDVTEHLNILLDYYWTRFKIGFLQYKAGERAALTNLGIVQVGWDTAQKEPTYKNVDPTHFLRDPYAPNLENAAYCITYDELHQNILKNIPLYKDTWEKALEATKMEASSTSLPIMLSMDTTQNASKQSDTDYYMLIIHWVRAGDGKMYEIHTLDNQAVLHCREIKPAMFPFALLYCNEPAGDIIGTSEPAKIFANTVCYNIMNSVMLTADYKNQRPPKFVSSSSGINLRSFIQHGNDADRTFVVNGDASRAVHYHEFPVPSQTTPRVLETLGQDIQMVTGVDGRYTGRDTGSVLTTGGMEAMLNQVTMIDATKVMQYEKFTEDLTRLTIANLVEFGAKRTYFIPVPNKNEYKEITIDFPKLTDKIFCYAINISSELPKNKARIAQAANVIVEKQMQYAQAGIQVELLTPEEWLMFQDIPFKEMIQERMGIQRNKDYIAKVTQVLAEFSELTRSGVPPTDAIELVAGDLQAQDHPSSEVPQMPMMPDAPPPPAEPMPIPQEAPPMF